MGLDYRNLENTTRHFMKHELDMDVSNSRVYLSARLTPQGVIEWPALLREALDSHNDDWLANEIRSRGFLRTHEERRKPKGGVTIAQVPVTAHVTMAEGEFNRYYVRGVCLRAVENNIPNVIAYRARYSENPRAESELILGKSFDASKVLADLRDTIGVEPALGVPPGPNSGLSVHLP